MLCDSLSYIFDAPFQKFLPEYLDSHSLTPQQWKTANHIANCKTGGLGYNVSYYEECGHTMLSGGGLTASGQFVEAAHKGYLLPKDAMGKLYRKLSNGETMPRILYLYIRWIIKISLFNQGNFIIYASFETNL